MEKATLDGPAIRVRPGRRRLVVTGATGTLGRAFSRICSLRGLDHVLLSRAEMEITDRASVEAALDLHRPWAVVNAAGYVRVADAEREREACMLANASGPEVLAAACAARGLPLLTFSSDLVFDGSLGRPYVEGDQPSPTGVYGPSKVEAERRVLEAFPEALVVRTSAFFGPWDRHNFVWQALNTASAGRIFGASRTALVSPTYVPDLVHWTLDLLLDGERGLWHATNAGATSCHALAAGVVQAAGLDPSLAVANEDVPSNTVLTSERGLMLPPLETAVERFLHDCEIRWAA